jgi:hypothetical protein
MQRLPVSYLILSNKFRRVFVFIVRLFILNFSRLLCDFIVRQEGGGIGSFELVFDFELPPPHWAGFFILT